MAFNSKYTGAQVEALLDKVNDETANVIEFNGVVSSVTLQSTSSTSTFSASNIYYCESLGCFVAKEVTTVGVSQTVKYYQNWDGADSYNVDGKAKDGVFVDISKKEELHETITLNSSSSASTVNTTLNTAFTNGKTVLLKGTNLAFTISGSTSTVRITFATFASMSTIYSNTKRYVGHTIAISNAGVVYSCVVAITGSAITYTAYQLT